MGTNNKSVFRGPLIVGYLGMIISMLACATIIGGSINAEPGTLQVGNGEVEIVNENGSRVPVAGTSTFELVGALESLDPWTVAGQAFETNESSRIEEDLQVDDIVRVRGTILEDGTWLAYSIERAEEEVDPIIILIGTVDSMDPWVVNGITLNITEETEIQGEITVDMLVRVEILLLPDRTWQVLSIAPLGDLTEIEGCVTVIATVVAINGNEIQFLGWPSVTLGENVVIEDDEGQDIDITVILNQDVFVVVCPSEEGQIVIVQIIIFGLPPVDGGTEPPTEGERVLVCHKPDKNAHTLSLPQSAIPAHLGHGDILGPCP